jgi:protein SCO1
MRLVYHTCYFGGCSYYWGQDKVSRTRGSFYREGRRAKSIIAKEYKMHSVTDSTGPGRAKMRPGGRRLAILLTIGIVLGLLLGLLLIRLSQGEPLFGSSPQYGVALDPAEPVNFSLTAHTGDTINLSDFQGKPVLLYFGYTFCPDVCPATMMELKWMMEELGRRADQVQVIMVSVDPERDIPAQLGEYVTSFHPSFIGLTGTEEELAAVTAEMGVYVYKHEGTAATGYLIDHTATVQVLDGNGRLRLLFPFGTTGKEMAADMRHLLRE